MEHNQDVRYELMRPADVVRRRLACPLAYLPLGGIEWHGMHNPLGLDGIKAHELCVRAARRTGGLVFPVPWYGEMRESHLAEANDSAREAIAEAMSWPEANFKRGHMGGKTTVEQAQFFQELIFHIYYQIRSLGFKAIYVLVGHGPMLPYACLARSLSERETAVKVQAEHTGGMVEGFKTGHGGRMETGLILAMRPELVELNELPDGDSSNLVGLAGLDPRQGAAEAGDAFLQALLDHMVQQAQQLLERPVSDGGLGIE